MQQDTCVALLVSNTLPIAAEGAADYITTTVNVQMKGA